MSTAIYVRVSTERQTLAQTIEQQVERLTAYVYAQGEALRPEDIFRDDGYSGATLNRPGLDHLRDRVKEATIDRVMIASPDRLARNYVHCTGIFIFCVCYESSYRSYGQPRREPQPPSSPLPPGRIACAEAPEVLIAPGSVRWMRRLPCAPRRNGQSRGGVVQPRYRHFITL